MTDSQWNGANRARRQICIGRVVRILSSNMLSDSNQSQKIRKCSNEIWNHRWNLWASNRSSCTNLWNLPNSRRRFWTLCTQKRLFFDLHKQGRTSKRQQQSCHSNVSFRQPFSCIYLPYISTDLQHASTCSQYRVAMYTGGPKKWYLSYNVM